MSLLAKLWRLLDLPKGMQLFIMRLFQDQFLIGVTGVIFNEKKEVLLFKHSYRQTAWSLPGGYIKAKEHPEEGLAREIEEESGLKVEIHHQLRLRTDRDSARLDITLIGTYISGTFTPSTEVTQGKFFSPKDLPEISESQKRVINKAIKRMYPVHHRINRFFSWFHK